MTYVQTAEVRAALVVGLVAFAIGMSPLAHAQGLGDLTIPADRIPHFNPGVEGGVPDTSGYPVINAVTAHGATPSNGTSGSDAPAIQAAIDAAAARGVPTVVYLPEGTYYLRGASLLLRDNVVLRGDGPTRTRVLALNGSLTVTPDGSFCGSAVIQFCSGGSSGLTNVTGGLSRGSTTLNVANASGISVGDWIFLRQNNDPAYIDHNDGADNMSHFARATAKNGNSITISNALRHDFSLAQSPTVSAVDMIERAGVEDMQLEFDAASADVWQPVVMFKQAANSWIKNADLYRGWHYLVVVDHSAFNTIEGSHLRTIMWHERGNPPWNGYGVQVADGSSDNLITNNVFTDVYIQVMLSGGAAGNVLSYNYIQTDACHHGLFLHGHYPHDNLMEGNDTNCWLGWDNYWGRQGPRNTFFRNRARGGSGEWFADAPQGARGIRSHHDQPGLLITDVNIIANTMGVGMQVPTGWDIDSSTTGMWLERNLNYVRLYADQPGPTSTVRNNVTANSAPGSWSSVNVPASLYLTGPPSFWPIGKPWPAIGATVDNMGNPASLNRLPAQERFEGADTTPPGAPQIIFE